jgi:hypothetical protein
MNLLHALDDEAASPGGVTRASFVAGALRGLSIGLCRGNSFMYRACLGMLAKCSGTGSGLACVCPQMSMGCCRIPACAVCMHVKFRLSAPVPSMWLFGLLL